MIVIGSNTSDNGQSHFTEDVLHFMELRQNRQLALLKWSAKNGTLLFSYNRCITNLIFFQLCVVLASAQAVEPVNAEETSISSVEKRECMPDNTKYCKKNDDVRLRLIHSKNLNCNQLQKY